VSYRFLIEGALADAYSPETFIKVAAGETPGMNFGELLKNPMVAYGLTGAGVGGVGSLLRSLLGSPDADSEGGIVARLLKAMSMGGLAGAGVAGGAQLLGKKLPLPEDIVRKITEGGTPEPTAEKSPEWQTSAGVGLTGAAGVGLLGVLARRRMGNRALSNVVGHLKGHTAAGANLLAPKRGLFTTMHSAVTGLSPRARGALRYLRKHQTHQTGLAGEIADNIQNARGGELERLSGEGIEGFLSKLGPKGALGTGGGIGILHQLMGRE